MRMGWRRLIVHRSRRVLRRPSPAANPAVFMLEATAPSQEQAQGIDWAQRWAQSEQAK